ncbi:MAG: hypothetical protein QME96_08965 [Myxococcota bacterium]|nr:hypothetical protein [Myxococcota bacterium]
MEELRRVLDDLEGVPQLSAEQTENFARAAAEAEADLHGWKIDWSVIARRPKGKLSPIFEQTPRGWRNVYAEDLPPALFMRGPGGRELTRPAQAAKVLGGQPEAYMAGRSSQQGGLGRAGLHPEDLRGKEAYGDAATLEEAGLGPAQLPEDFDFGEVLRQRYRSLRETQKPMEAGRAFFTKEGRAAATRADIERAKPGVLREHEEYVRTLREEGALPPARTAEEEADALDALVARRAIERKRGKIAPQTSPEIERELGRTGKEGIHAEASQLQIELSNAQNEVAEAVQAGRTATPAQLARVEKARAAVRDLVARRGGAYERLDIAATREEAEATSFDPAELEAMLPRNHLPAIPPGSELERRLDAILDTRAGLAAVERKLIPPEQVFKPRARAFFRRMEAVEGPVATAAVRRQWEEAVARKAAQNDWNTVAREMGVDKWAAREQRVRVEAPVPALTAQAASGAPRGLGGLPPPTGQPFRPPPPGGGRAGGIGQPPPPSPQGPTFTLPANMQKLRDFHVERMKAIYQEAQAAGVPVSHLDNYVYHLRRDKGDNWLNELAARIGHRGPGGKFPFLKKRQERGTLAELTAADPKAYEPSLLIADAAREVGHARMMEAAGFIEDLKKYLRVEFGVNAVKDDTGALTFHISKLEAVAGPPPSRETIAYLGEAINSLLRPEKVNAALRLVDSVNRLQMPLLTSVRGGYTYINSIGNLWKMWVRGALDLRSVTAALGAMLVNPQLPLAVTERKFMKWVSDWAGAKTLTSRATGNTATLAELKRQAELHRSLRIYSPSFGPAEHVGLRELTDPLRAAGLKEVSPVYRAAGAVFGGATMGPAGAVAGAALGPTAVRFASVGARAVEDHAWLSAFINGFDKGLSYDAAAARANEILLHKRLGDFGEKFVRRAFLFSRWGLLNLPSEAAGLLIRPAGAKMLGHATEAGEAWAGGEETQPDEMWMDDWMKRLVRFRERERTRYGSTLYFDLRTPLGDAGGWGVNEMLDGDLAGAFRAVLGQATPLGRIPIEQAVRQFLRSEGREIKEGTAGFYEPAAGPNAIKLAEYLAKLDPDFAPRMLERSKLEPGVEVPHVRSWVNRTVELFGGLMEYDRAFAPESAQTTAVREKTPYRTPIGQVEKVYNPLVGYERKMGKYGEVQKKMGSVRQGLQRAGIVPNRNPTLP